MSNEISETSQYIHMSYCNHVTLSYHLTLSPCVTPSGLHTFFRPSSHTENVPAAVCFCELNCFFFSIAATLRVQSTRWMWLSYPVPPCCVRVWCVAGQLLATHFVLLPDCSICSDVKAKVISLSTQRFVRLGNSGEILGSFLLLLPAFPLLALS